VTFGLKTEGSRLSSHVGFSKSAVPRLEIIANGLMIAAKFVVVTVASLSTWKRNGLEIFGSWGPKVTFLMPPSLVFGLIRRKITIYHIHTAKFLWSVHNVYFKNCNAVLFTASLKIISNCKNRELISAMRNRYVNSLTIEPDSIKPTATFQPSFDFRYITTHAIHPTCHKSLCAGSGVPMWISL
jgi:hypothetical protein